jgi:hypothetical protein
MKGEAPPLGAIRYNTGGKAKDQSAIMQLNGKKGGASSTKSLLWLQGALITVLP